LILKGDVVMSESPPNERRKYSRYETEVKVYFRVKYNIKTLVKFRILNRKDPAAEKCSALSHNVSAEGISFSSERQLKTSDRLLLEVYLPDSKNPILMEGEVVWSLCLENKSRPNEFFTGVKLLKVSGQSVADSIHYDEQNKILWSIVLESIFGSFRTLAQKLRETKNSQ